MVLANTPALAGLIPGQMIGDPTIVTSSSATVDNAAGEVVFMTWTDTLLAGHEYWVRSETSWAGSATNTSARIRIRRDDTSGAGLNQTRIIMPIVTAIGYRLPLSALFPALVSGEHTFVVTGVLLGGGADNFNLEAGSDKPSQFWVDYARPTP